MYQFICKCCISLLLLMPTCHAQLQLKWGMSPAQVRRILGPPTGYYSAGSHYRTYPHTGYPVLATYRRVIDGQLYELRPGLELDPTTRLRERLVLATLFFEGDRAESARSLAHRFAELRAICSAGCIVYRRSFKGDMPATGLYARPINPALPFRVEFSNDSVLDTPKNLESKVTLIDVSGVYPESEKDYVEVVVEKDWRP